MAAGQATITADTDNPLNSARSAKIVADGADAGLVQTAFWARQGDALRGSLFVRGSTPDGLRVRLMDGTHVLAEQAVAAPKDQWAEVPVVLTPNADCGNASLQILSKGKGTFWVDQVSLMPDSYKANGGFRTDLLEAINGLRPASMRWPGGSFVGTGGGYHWKNAVGPQAKRVGKVGWDEQEPLAFGTDEFMALCKKTNAEPVVVIYLGSRTAGADHGAEVKEAAEWVEYCNGPADSPMGKLRAANGHAQPYGVKYWEIDNEIWSMQPDDYVRVVKEFVPAMKKVDPTIKTIACGSGGFSTGRFTEGDVAVINQASDVVDFLSLHHYENVARFDTGPATAVAYYDKMAALIAKAKNPNLKIYMSEWNLQTTDWRTGLYAGEMLNEFERDPVIGMACPALFLRHASAPAWDNAFINFNNTSWYAAPNYLVMKLFHDHFQPNLLETLGEAKPVNVTATESADGKQLVLKLVNPSDQPVTLAVTVSGKFPAGTAAKKLELLAPDNLSARNTFDSPTAVHITDGGMPRSGNAGTMTVSLPRWSVGVLEMKAP